LQISNNPSYVEILSARCKYEIEQYEIKVAAKRLKTMRIRDSVSENTKTTMPHQIYSLFAITCAFFQLRARGWESCLVDGTGSKRWPSSRVRGWGNPWGERTAVEGGTGRFVATRASSEIAKPKNAIFK